MKHSIIILVLFAVGIALLSASVIVDPCFAGNCKHENAECTINNSKKPCCAGLTCVPFNDNSGNGKCRKSVEPPPECIPNGEATCPTECGYDGGTIKDNCGNKITCQPTEKCEEPNKPPKPPKPPATTTSVVLSVTGI